jgi:hypothetical protein
LYSDGSVSIHRYDGTKRKKSIDPAKVATLLKKLDKLGFYRITSQSVEASIEKFTTKTTRTSRFISIYVAQSSGTTRCESPAGDDATIRI